MAQEGKEFETKSYQLFPELYLLLISYLMLGVGSIYGDSYNGCVN